MHVGQKWCELHFPQRASAGGTSRLMYIVCALCVSSNVRVMVREEMGHEDDLAEDFTLPDACFTPTRQAQHLHTTRYAALYTLFAGLTHINLRLSWGGVPVPHGIGPMPAFCIAGILLVPASISLCCGRNTSSTPAQGIHLPHSCCAARQPSGTQPLAPLVPHNIRPLLSRCWMRNLPHEGSSA